MFAPDTPTHRCPAPPGLGGMIPTPTGGTRTGRTCERSTESRGLRQSLQALSALSVRPAAAGAEVKGSVGRAGLRRPRDRAGDCTRDGYPSLKRQGRVVRRRHPLGFKASILFPLLVSIYYSRWSCPPPVLEIPTTTATITFECQAKPNHPPPKKIKIMIINTIMICWKNPPKIRDLEKSAENLKGTMG